MSAAPEHKPLVSEARLRVRYAETDQMGVVYHSNFVIWFEVGRVELLRSLGITYQQMEVADDCHLPVVDLRCRYKAPARYDEQIVVRTSFRNIRDSLIHFAYEVVRETDGTLLAEGETTHIVTDASMKRRPLPGRYLQLFQRALGRG